MSEMQRLASWTLAFGLPGFRVVHESRGMPADPVRFTVLPTQEVGICPHCGHACDTVHRRHHSSPIKDLPLGDQPVELILSTPQYECQRCQRFFTPTWPAVVPVNTPTTRRSLYFVHSHNDQQKFLSIFDDASVLECYRRAESILPQQTLALQNSRLAQTATEKIAARLDTPTHAADGAFVRVAFETILGQTPSAAEEAECAGALRDLRSLAEKEKRPAPARHARTALVHALLNHNDFVTIR